VFPTVTRVNASSFATGRYPNAHGILGNTVYAPAVDANNAISTGEYQRLRALEQVNGRLLLTDSLGEIVARHYVVTPAGEFPARAWRTIHIAAELGRIMAGMPRLEQSLAPLDCEQFSRRQLQEGAMNWPLHATGLAVTDGSVTTPNPRLQQARGQA
jgi:hypothetical protein